MRRTLWIAISVLVLAMAASGADQPPPPTSAPFAAGAPEGRPPASEQRVTAATEAFASALDASEKSIPKKRLSLDAILETALAIYLSAGYSSPYVDTSAYKGFLPKLVGQQIAGAILRGEKGYRWLPDSYGFSLLDPYRETLRVKSKARAYDTAFWAVEQTAIRDYPASLRLARAFKDQSYRAKALCVVAGARIAYGHADEALQAYGEAVSLADTELTAGEVGASILDSAGALSKGQPEKCRKLLAMAEPLLTRVSWKGKDEQTQNLGRQVIIEFAKLKAEADPTGAQNYLDAIPDSRGRACAYLLVATDLAQAQPQVSEQLITEADSIAKNKMDKQGQAVVSTVKAWCQLARSIQQGEEGIEQLALLYLRTEPDAMMKATRMCGLLEAVTRNSEDLTKAKAWVDYPMIIELVGAIVHVYAQARDQEKDAYYAVSEYGRFHDNPYWEQVRTTERISCLLWGSAVVAANRIDPELAKKGMDLVQAVCTKVPEVSALSMAGTISMAQAASGEADKAKYLDAAVASWDGLRKSGLKGWKKELLADGAYNRRKSECLNQTYRNLAPALAAMDFGKALKMVDDTMNRYVNLGAFASSLSATDPTIAVRIISEYPAGVDRAAADRCLAGIVAGEDPDKGIEVFLQAQKQCSSAPCLHEGENRDWDNEASARDLSTLVTVLVGKDPAKAQSFVSSLKDPYQRCQSGRLLACKLHESSAEAGDKAFKTAIDDLSSIKDPESRFQATADMAVSVARYDTGQGMALANGIEDPAQRSWARALIAAKLDGTDQARFEELLRSAQSDLPSIKDPKRRAYASYTVARAWLGAEKDRMIAEADAPVFPARPW